MQLRSATHADAAAIAAIYNEGIEDREATFETRPRDARRGRGVARRAGLPFLVAERGGDVARLRARRRRTPTAASTRASASTASTSRARRAAPASAARCSTALVRARPRRAGLLQAHLADLHRQRGEPRGPPRGGLRGGRRSSGATAGSTASGATACSSSGCSARRPRRCTHPEGLVEVYRLRRLARLTWDAVLAWRTRRQHLAERAPARRALARRVATSAGLHAQVMSSRRADAVGARRRPRAGTVEARCGRTRTLVKTWAMRGTLHLLRADELPRYIGALARLRPRHHVPAWLRALRPHARAGRGDARRRSRGAAPGAPLTRDELAAAVAAARAGKPALEAKLARRLRRPAQARRVHRRPLLRRQPDGQRVRFTRPADWLGGSPARTRASRRPARSSGAYLAAYGPAPREQFQRWFGMTSPAEAGRWLKALGDERRGGRRRGEPRLDARRRRRRGGRRGASRASCGCCPPSTTTSSRRRAAPRPCCPAATARTSTARRAGSRPCSWSTGGWPARGRTRSSGAPRV